MKLVICNKGGGSFVAKAKEAATAVFGAPSVTVLEKSDHPTAEQLRGFTHILCHLHSTKRLEPSWPKLMAGDVSKAKVIIRVSSVGAPGMDSFASPYRHTDNGPWVLHLYSNSGEVSKQEWQKVFQALKTWKASDDALPAPLAAVFECSFEAELALRLLCEAWEMTKPSSSSEISGITIHSPQERKDWLTPFEKHGNATKATALMGTVQNEAAKIFDALGKPRRDLSKAVKAFLKATARKLRARPGKLT